MSASIRSPPLAGLEMHGARITLCKSVILSMTLINQNSGRGCESGLRQKCGRFPEQSHRHVNHVPSCQRSVRSFSMPFAWSRWRPCSPQALPMLGFYWKPSSMVILAASHVSLVSTRKPPSSGLRRSALRFIPLVEDPPVPAHGLFLIL